MRGLARMVRRLLAHWQGADPLTRTQGLDWYVHARATCRALAAESGHDVATACGVIAALSPRLQWARNLRAARAVLTGEAPRGVFRSSLRKAQRIAAGEYPLEVLGGSKVRAFYAALMGDDSAAVVDTWVVKAVGWTRYLTAKAYRLIAKALQVAAGRAGVPVARLQAVVWVAVRGRAA